MLESSKNVETKQEKPDRAETHGKEIEITNYASDSGKSQNENKAKTDQTEAVAEGAMKHTNAQTSEDKKSDVQSRSSSTYSLNSRRKKDEPADRTKDKVSIDEDVDTAIHAQYLTDDMKQGSSSEQEEQDEDSKSRTSQNKIHWKEADPSDTKSIEKEKDTKNDHDSKENVPSSPKSSSTKDRSQSRSSSSSSDRSEQEKPHLITTYKKPTTTSNKSDEKAKEPQALKPSQPCKGNAKQSSPRYQSQSARYPQRGYQSRDSRPTSSGRTSRTSRSIPSRPRTTLGFSTGEVF